jgi:beta-mannosidase
VSVDASGSALPPEGLRLRCAGREIGLRPVGSSVFRGELELPGAALWWPHTHGTPHLHDVDIVAGTIRFDCGRVGFRSLAVDTSPSGDSFGLIVNGEAVFCRGACWTGADIVNLTPGRERYRSLLALARDAGMNMLRVGGTGIYEADDFYDLCDELGILVWQDFMFANFDYPAGDAHFRESVEAEARQFLDRRESSPCLAVLCGGSEVEQQAAMLGLPQSHWSNALFQEQLPALSGEFRPDVPYVVNSPSGGPLPFVADHGVTHYYGVGAYLRPLADARLANVRFASECLGFSQVPDGVDAAALASRLWKERVPRDRGASWDFEDVRDHYLAELYGVEPARLRKDDAPRYLELSRAVTADVLEASLSEWRREGSVTQGALVWTFMDPWAGAGWGVIAADGTPKSAWYALKHVSASVFLGISDEGVNGLRLHWHNETAETLRTVLRFSCLREGQTPVREASRPLDLAPRSAGSVDASDLLGGFFDCNYAYRFGPPSHDSCVAILANAANGETLARAFHFLQDFASARQPIAISASLESRGEVWTLVLTSERLARRVHIDDDAYLPADNWFHLAPGEVRRIPLSARSGSAPPPRGTVAAVNSSLTTSYRAAS